MDFRDKTLRDCLFDIADGFACIVEMIRDPVLRSTGHPESLTNIDEKVITFNNFCFCRDLGMEIPELSRIAGKRD